MGQNEMNKSIFVNAPSNTIGLRGRIDAYSASSQVATFGSTARISTMNLYMGNDSNLGYILGVENPTSPVFWIGRQMSSSNLKKLVYINAQSGFVGIGTTNPMYSMDVYGDLHLSGQLVQEGTNLILTTETIQSTINTTSSISVTPGADAIDFTYSPIKNVGTARFSSSVYVEDTIYASNINVYGSFSTVNHNILTSDRVYIDNYDNDGPAIRVQQHSPYPVATFYTSDSNAALAINEIGNVGILTPNPSSALHVTGVSIQDMGSIRRISGCVGGITITKLGGHRLGFIFTWANVATSERDMIQADVTFYGSGSQTRTYMSLSQFINPINNGSTLPGADIVTDYKQVKYKSYPNIKYVKSSIVRNSATSVYIRAEWYSDVATNYNVNMKIDIMSPIALGFVSLTSSYTKL